MPEFDRDRRAGLAGGEGGTNPSQPGQRPGAERGEQQYPTWVNPADRRRMGVETDRAERGAKQRVSQYPSHDRASGHTEGHDQQVQQPDHLVIGAEDGRGVAIRGEQDAVRAGGQAGDGVQCHPSRHGRDHRRERCLPQHTGAAECRHRCNFDRDGQHARHDHAKQQ